MALATEIEINLTNIKLMHKLLQLPQLRLIELRQEVLIWTFPYTSKSCAKADKNF